MSVPTPRPLVMALLLAASVPLSLAATAATTPAEPPDIAAEVAAAPAVVLEDVTSWTIEPYSSVLDVTRRIRINSAEGLGTASQSLTYGGQIGTKWETKLLAFSGRTIAPDGRVSEITPDLQQRSVLQEHGEYRLSQLKFTFPNVTPGSIIEWNYRTERENSLPWPWWEIQGQYPVLSSRFVVHSGRPTTLESWIVRGYSRVPIAPWCQALDARTEPNHDIYEFVCRNVPAFVHEQLAPPESDVRLRMMLVWDSPDEYYQNPWGNLPPEFWSHWRHFNDKPGKARSVSRDVIGRGGTSAERIERLGRFVRRSVALDDSRPWGLGSDGDARTADEVLERGRGSSLELVALTRLLAEELGFNAYLALIADTSEQSFKAEIPDISQGTRFMVEVNDGKSQWTLDPACAHCDIGIPEARYCTDGRAGIRFPNGTRWRGPSETAIAGKDGSNTITTSIEPIPAARNALVRTERVVLDARGDGRVTAHLAWDGQLEQERRDALAARAAATRGELLLETEPGDLAESTATVTDPDDMETPLSAELGYRVTGLAVAPDERTLVVRGRDTISPVFPLPTGETRRYPVLFRKASTHRTVTTYALPDGFAAKALPKDVSLAIPGAKASVTWKTGASPNELVATSELVIDKIRFQVKDWPALRDLVDRFHRALKTEVTLVRGGA